MAETTRLEELQRRVQRDPASISFAALAEEYRRLGLFQDAIDTCRAGLLRHPSYPSARVTLGRSLLEIGEFDDASSELERVLRVAPENLAAIRALAEIHRRRGEMPESVEHYADEAPAPAPVEEASALIEEPPAPIVITRSFEPPAPVAIEPSHEAPLAVQSTSVVETHTESASLAGLEAFLAAIHRARRDTNHLAAR